MKILAIDPGLKRIGLASCDELALTTSPREILFFSSFGQVATKLRDLILAEGVQKVVIGLPLHMDGREGSSVAHAKKIGRYLENAIRDAGCLCPIEFWDERLTSFEAESRMRERGVSKLKSKDFIDSVAALVLLEDYLASHPIQK